MGDNKYPDVKKKNIAKRRLENSGGRQYFDSGDYAMCSAGKGGKTGSAVPTPDNINAKKKAGPQKSRLAELKG